MIGIKLIDEWKILIKIYSNVCAIIKGTAWE
jgi:hypothetical protein